MKVREFFKDNSENVNKDWRDAFLEYEIIEEDMIVNHSVAEAIKIESCSTCYKYQSICGYVSQFEYGGFWFDDEELHFVTNGSSVDKEATYDDARMFLENWDKSEGE